MQTVDLAQTSVATTRLGFGCAGLMQLASRKKRQDLLAAAFDAGVAHFDVARMYGLGAAEGELGHFARDRRDRLVIATKFGIDAAPPSWMARLQGPARALIARYPALRRAVKRRGDVLHNPRRYDADIARASLERSLRELQTDYVDIFFVHDPGDADDVAVEGLRDFLESAREAGSIRCWGIAGEMATALRTAESFPCDVVLQARDDILSRPVAGSAVQPIPQITFGALSSALERILRHVRSSDLVRHRWREATGLDCSTAAAVSSLLLQDSLEANANGAVLFSTTKSERIASNAGVVDRTDKPVLRAFQGLVSTDFGHHLASPAHT